MKFRKTKFDFSLIRKKRNLAKPTPLLIKREVVQTDFPLLKKTQPKKETRKLGETPKSLKPTFEFAGLKLLYFAFVCLLIVSVVPVTAYLSLAEDTQTKILGISTSAYEDLNQASQSLEEKNFEQASGLFKSAQGELNSAIDELNKYKPLSLIDPRVNSADHVLKGASLLAVAGSKTSDAMSLLGELKVSSGGVETSDFTHRLSQNKYNLEEALNFLNLAEEHFSRAKSLPTEYQASVDEARVKISNIVLLLQNLIELEDLYLALFSGSKTYLLVFPNYNEARATGGFLGTYGLLKIDDGKIRRLSIESIYNLDGSFYENIAAPGPMQPQIQKWGIRDANWFADFPSSAAKILYFYEKAKETTDGVISITPAMFEDLLALVGPIYMQQYAVVLTPENFQQTVQYKTSFDFDHNLNQPKKFLADFAPILLNRLVYLSQDDWLKFFEITTTNLSKRQILIYSTTPATQQKILELGYAGNILDADQDYLNIINTNLGGTKTDLDVEQQARLKTYIQADGLIVNTLEVTRRNQALKPNKNYMRVLVPNGSGLISAQGMDALPHNRSQAEGLKTDPDLALWDKGQLIGHVFVRKEANKTEFAFWFITEGSEAKSIALTYALPFRLKPNFVQKNKTYSLIVQKQPGSRNLKFEQEFQLNQFKTVWSSPNVHIENGSLRFSSNSSTDDFWATILSE